MADMTASQHIDSQIAELGDWRGELFACLRKLINQTDPTLQEVWKWDTAVWAVDRGGNSGKMANICAVSAFNGHVKMNFFKGALLNDPHRLFNSGLDSKEHRSINFAGDSLVHEAQLRALIQEALALAK